MNNPQLIKIESETVTADRVRQRCYMTANSEKIPLLIGLVRTWEDPRVMVFVNTKREADRVWGYLQGNGINTAVLSGDVPQKKRLKLLKSFTDGDLPVLVGTDVAARGLHIPDVTHVVNYDLPEDAEDYVHRIGRTARAGAAGDAISFVCETYAFCLPDIERFIGAKVPVEPVESHLLPEIDYRSRLRPDREDREYRTDRDGRGPPGSGGPRGRDGRGPGGRRDAPHGPERPRPADPAASPDQGPTTAPDAPAAVAATPPPRPPRRARPAPEQAALTSPTASPRETPADHAGASEASPQAGAEPAKKRRRRRRKPAAKPGDTQTAMPTTDGPTGEPTES
jgi:ATP-dependent RNA helicase RhlB